jgi:hypothetical protein
MRSITPSVNARGPVSAREPLWGLGGTRQRPAQLRTRERRLSWLALCFAGTAAWTYAGAKTAWWTLQYAGGANQATSASTGTTALPSALTPAWLVSHGVLPSVGGICQPVSLALIAAFIAIGSLLLRSSFVGVVALCAYGLAWHSLSACILAVQGSNNLVAQAAGLHTFATALAMSALLLLCTTLQLAWMNHRKRVEHRAHSAENGEEVPSFGDVILSLAQSRLAKFGGVNDDHTHGNSHSQ